MSVIVHKRLRQDPPSVPNVSTAPNPLAAFQKLDRGFLPESFISQIETSNAKKTINDPIALVFQPEKDDAFGTFSTAALQYNYLEVSKTHLLFLTNMKDADLRGAISKFRPLLKEPNKTSYEDLAIFLGHGKEDAMKFGDSPDQIFSSKGAAIGHFKELRQKTALLFLSCLTGQHLAPKIAAFYPGKVAAPQEFLHSSAGFSIYHCPEHGIELAALNMTTKEQHVSQFTDLSEDEPCFDRKILKKQAAYLKAEAEKGSQKACADLSFCYEYGLGVRKSLEQAKKWLRASLTNCSLVTEKIQYQTGRTIDKLVEFGILRKVTVEQNPPSQSSAPKNTPKKRKQPSEASS